MKKILLTLLTVSNFGIFNIQSDQCRYMCAYDIGSFIEKLHTVTSIEDCQQQANAACAFVGQTYNESQTYTLPSGQRVQGPLSGEGFITQYIENEN